MKKIIIAAYILLCICLTGCGGTNQKDYGENYNQEQDAQNFSMIRNAAATENGFYVLQDQYVYFIDKKSKKAVPLCGKPNCKHKDNSCNAHFTHPENIQAYAGNLYVVAGGSEELTCSLYRISLDGSQREELKVLFRYDSGDSGCSLDFTIHRGYGYMAVNWMQKDREKKTQTLYQILLDSSDEKKEVAQVTGYVPLIHVTETRGNHIYFTTSCYLDKDGTEEELLNYEWNILEGSSKKLNIPKGEALLAVRGERYFCYQDGKGLRSYDENGKNEKKLFEWQYEICSVCRDEKYIYFDNEPCADSVSERRIMVVDYDGNVICERKNMTENSPEIIWSDSKQVLLQNIEKETYQILNLKEISTLK